MAKVVEITKEEIEHVALLAHIELTEEEKQRFTEQFNEILSFFRTIDKAPVEDVPPTFHVLELYNITRQDEVEESLSEEDALQNAPKKERGYFKAPRIV